MTDELLIPHRQISAVLKAAEETNVKTLEQVMDAADLLLDIKNAGEAVTAAKEEVTKPLNEALKKQRARYKPYEEQCSEAEAIVKQKILDWHGAHWNEDTMQDNTIHGLRGKVTVVERFRLEIDDPEAIPRNLCNPDDERVRKALEAGLKVKGARLIPLYAIAAAKN